jgi:hypothetical protein
MSIIRPTLLAFAIDDPRSLAEVYLHFVARTHFHPSERECLAGLQPSHEAQHAVIAAGKTLLALQVLKEALSGQAQIELALDEGSTGPATNAPNLTNAIH